MRSFKLGDITLADHPQAELLVISCTDYRALEAAPALERALGKPVIASIDLCLSQATRDRHEQYRGRWLSVYPPELVMELEV